MRITWRRQNGLTLIEMMIALVIAAIIIAGVYRTFAVQQKNFVVQEQVADAQQSVRAVMDLMTRDIRMAGFGQPPWGILTFTDPVTLTSATNFTVVGAFSPPQSVLKLAASEGDTTIRLLDGHGERFGALNNLLIFGPTLVENVLVQQTTGEDDPVQITTDPPATVGLVHDHPPSSTIFLVTAATYAWNAAAEQLTRNNAVLANDVTGFQITQVATGVFRINMTVRTRTNDPDFPNGFRTRTLTSTITARNM